jgi:transposase, IS5 family
MWPTLGLLSCDHPPDDRVSSQYLIRDRLSWLRFLGFDLGAPTPEANTIRLFRERLTEAKAIKVLFNAFDNRIQP